MLSPRLAAPGWSFEHRPSAAWRAWAPATLAFLMPWRAWHQLRLELIVRPDRLVAYALALAAAAHLAHAATSAVLAWQTLLWFNALIGAPAPSTDALVEHAAKAALWPYGTLDLHTVGLGLFEGYTPPGLDRAGLLVMLVAPPLVCLVLPATMRRAKVRPAHVLRAWVGTLPIAMAAVLLSLVLFAIDQDHRLFGAQRSLAWPSLLGSIALLAAWWWIIRRYLRLREARRVWIALATITTLATVTTVVLIDPFALFWLGLPF